MSRGSWRKPTSSRKVPRIETSVLNLSLKDIMKSKGMKKSISIEDAINMIVRIPEVGDKVEETSTPKIFYNIGYKYKIGSTLNQRARQALFDKDIYRNHKINTWRFSYIPKGMEDLQILFSRGYRLV